MSQLSYVISLILVYTTPVAALDWKKCLANIRDNKQLNMSDTTWFQPNSTALNPLLTLKGCDALCGPRPDFYGDAGSILNTWILPALVTERL